ncbi:MAG TPA: FAD/NAD(P)-binding oxidoreductase [Saprospiraceae bacterium]|nr:FAD/NAD(P)-binding oxidoreductase [Saprospiraceae bacterium]
MAHIVIIGNGIAGITAARWIRKLSDHQVTVISSESKYFFSRTALMYVYMGDLKWKDLEPYEPHFWTKNRIEILQDRVLSIDFENRSVELDQHGILSYDKLILATGSKSLKPDIPGIHLEGVTGLYHKSDLEYLERQSPSIKKAAIIGGGLIGIELAEMFYSRNIPFSMLVREPSYSSPVLPAEESQIINRHIREHGVDLRLSCGVSELVDDGTGKVCAVQTEQDERLAFDFVGITAGVVPNIDFLRNTKLESDSGILVDAFLETNITDVYAIGDCAQLRDPDPGRRAIEPLWYTGRMMGETAARNICGFRSAYRPGFWFNSAKFFDIEYQVYGQVPAIIQEPLNSFYWESADGQKSIRIVYENENKIVRGFNLMGIRFRQEVCEKWLRQKSRLEDVVAQIRLAFFDPEFYPDHGSEIFLKFENETGKQLGRRSGNALDAVLQFFKSKNTAS